MLRRDAKRRGHALIEATASPTPAGLRTPASAFRAATSTPSGGLRRGPARARHRRDRRRSPAAVAILIDASISGLPPFPHRGIGRELRLMIAHVTAAALASENKSAGPSGERRLAAASANQEDHGRWRPSRAPLGDMADNTGTRRDRAASRGAGIDFRRPLRSSEDSTRNALVRSVAPTWTATLPRPRHRGGEAAGGERRVRGFRGA